MAGAKALGWKAWRKAGLERAEARSGRAMPLGRVSIISMAAQLSSIGVDARLEHGDGWCGDVDGAERVV